MPSLSQQTIAVYQAQDKVLTVTMVPPTTISGWALVFTVRANVEDTAYVLRKSSAAGQVAITDPVNGVFTIGLTQADTAALAPGNYVWDVWRTSPGSSNPLAHGMLTVIGQAFKPTDT